MIDDTFTVTTQWQQIESGGSPVTDGTFSAFHQSGSKVFYKKDTTTPDQSDAGASFTRERGESVQYPLGATEFLYAKTGAGTSEIGVVSGDV